ncbi:mate-domain-containing protein [Protomyces lactucae-debilis]|uniref:Mate-domain-containing protein n=1 Tax=Protomyces lactucae-debilis TaxID=2754530 RepID=A0A1Y2F2K6_PROLT|nr:mate-domain-containing protein [Protomyces lactucae-debilis]ORY78118.1 mate-domain-containing protein [Protomyces lactucae-debilis]
MDSSRKADSQSIPKPPRSSRGSDISARHKPEDHALAASYRRPSFVASSGYARSTLLATSPAPKSYLQREEVEDLEQEERELLREHHQPRRTHETRVLIKFSAPLILTFLLQSSEQFSTVFSLGHLGTKELGARFSVFQGIITALDTLCSQAYGAGKPKLIGVHVQRCLLFLIVLHIPIIAIWLNVEPMLLVLRQDPQISKLAGRYMRVFAFGMTPFALFETLKRFMQAQGLMSAATYVLCITAPINIILNYVLVWHKTLGFGFLGAPTAVVLTYWLQAILMLLYIRFIDGRQAWAGFSKAALTGWGPMLRLALPGTIMIVSEWAIFEATSIIAGSLGQRPLAAQSILTTTASLVFQTPFALSVAVSTRSGNLIGANLPGPARIACRTGLLFGAALALFFSVGLFLARHYIGLLFTSDKRTVALVAEVLPLMSLFVIFDTMGAVAGGVLRGMGKQRIGAIVNIPSYYLVGLPIGLALAFKTSLGLTGIWIGLSVALFLVSAVEMYVILRCDWETLVEEAQDALESTP